MDPDGCTPIQECSDGLHNCDVNADCTQLQPAGFACACKTGFIDTVVNGVVPEPGISCEDQGEINCLSLLTSVLTSISTSNCLDTLHQ